MRAVVLLVEEAPFVASQRSLPLSHARVPAASSRSSHDLAMTTGARTTCVLETATRTFTTT